MSAQVVDFAAAKHARSRKLDPVNLGIWPAMLTTTVMCWGLIGLTVIHLVPVISEAIRPR
ncbi:hypothetical protein ACKWRH_21400 [Bradyrhizobium sp. Pa8]|uniref:hypothetical protein n=1 Tax=Bradyrhizobium sp. Pa8 TaxID=3386552 RepID=UPI00403F4AAF